MIKSVILAVFFAMGTTPHAFPLGSLTDVTAVFVSSGDLPREQGCHDASRPWLPETLQIDDGARPTDQGESNIHFERKSASADCALV